jgi:hypothetical protein
MDIDWNTALIDQLDWLWEHQLRPRLDGLTDAEYFWEPVADCWSVRPPGQSSAPIAAGPGEYGVFGERNNREVIHHGAEIALLRDLYRKQV